MCGFANLSDLRQERDQLSRRTVVYARPSGQHVHVVEHVEQRRAGLMYGAHDRSALFGQVDQQSDALLDRHDVQSAVRKPIIIIIASYLIVLFDEIYTYSGTSTT